MNKRITNRVNYQEDNSEYEEENERSVVEEVLKDVVDNLQIGTPALQINKKKQYKKIYETSLCRGDWEMDSKRSLPKGNVVKDCYYFYFNFHPGVYKILIKDITKILNDDFGIKLKSGRPERFGDATIKSICNFRLRVEGEREKILQLSFYHTNNSLDLKMTGQTRNALEKFKDLGFKNGSVYFIEDVLPEVMKRILRENDIEASKAYWSDLAKEGYLQERKKEKEVTKTREDAQINKNVRHKKCGHCEKVIGKKVALQCMNCNNMNLVECLKDIEEGRIEDFKIGNDKFFCNKCISNINPDTLAIESSEQTNTLEEAVHEPRQEPAKALSEERNEIDESSEIVALKRKIVDLESDVKNLGSKNKHLEESSEAKKEEMEKLKKESNELKLDLAELKLDMSSKNNLIENLSAENTELGKELDEIKANRPVDNEISKYKEFLKRTQSQCKELETKLTKVEEKHKIEINEVLVKKQATEEKYGRLVKEKKLLEEKERILLNTFESLNKLSELKEGNAVNETSKENNTEKPVTDVPAIDITGEEANGGTSSIILNCEKCNYKSTMKDRMRQHIEAKHENLNITCDQCEFVGNTTTFLDHMKNNHPISNLNLDGAKKNLEKGKKSTNKNVKTKSSNVVIPCDICSFVGKTASDYMKHIEEHNKEKSDPTLPCELCDYKAKSATNFKEHLEVAHGIKLNGPLKQRTEHGNAERVEGFGMANASFKTVSHKNNRTKKGFCVFWNRGHCYYDNNTCFYEHKNIPACRFQERCRRSDCKFFHEEGLGKFPFLRSRNYPTKIQFQNHQSHHETRPVLSRFRNKV